MCVSLGKMLTGDGNIVWTVKRDGKVESLTVGRGHSCYEQLKRAYKNDDVEDFVNNLDVAESMRNYVSDETEGEYSGEGVVFNDVTNTFTYAGVPLHNNITERIFALKREGMPFKPMLTFLSNLMGNPSKNSVEELYSFLEHGNMPVTDDGCFLAYKTVRTHNGDTFVDCEGREVHNGDLVDKYSGKVRNNVGDINSMPRNMVDDNAGVGCSHGYHVGSLSYAGPGGWYNNSSDTVVIVKVNPKDAVSVPHDQSCQKLRTCRYEVVDVYSKPLERSLYTATSEEYEDQSEEDYVDPYSLVYGDFIEFDYTNKNGEDKSHCGFVEIIEDGLITLELSVSDPDFDDRDYSSFCINRMRKVDLL